MMESKEEISLEKLYKEKVNKAILVKDKIYKYIEISPLAKQIIDTVEFQRLRDLKQLGITHLIFPGATHNRFAHSIGVYHLTGEYINHLIKNTNWNEDEMKKFSLSSEANPERF